MVDNRPFPSHVEQVSPDEELVLHGDGCAMMEADEFSCGTVTGAWHLYAGSLFTRPVAQVLEIMDVRNARPGNGQFRRFLHQLIDHCQKHEYDLAFTNVGNPRLYKQLLERWGFQQTHRPDVVLLPCYAAISGSTLAAYEQEGA